MTDKHIYDRQTFDFFVVSHIFKEAEERTGSRAGYNDAADPWKVERRLTPEGTTPMLDPNLPATPIASTGPLPSIVVEMEGRRQIQLSRTPAGFYEIALAGPTRRGSAWGERLVIHGKLQVSAERVLETLSAISEICRRVDADGLPDAA